MPSKLSSLVDNVWPSKLSNLVGNLSEINNKDCKTCIERENIKSECEFIGLKNNRLNYRWKECNGTSAKSVNNLIEKFPNTYQFCNGDFNPIQDWGGGLKRPPTSFTPITSTNVGIKLKNLRTFSFNPFDRLV